MDLKKLGKRIRLSRIELDLNQTQLAEKINVRQKSISCYETGAMLPSLKTLLRIARALGKPAGYFLNEQLESKHDSDEMKKIKILKTGEKE